MKKLNKLFLGAASAASVAAPIAAVVSCGVTEEETSSLPAYVESTFASTDAKTVFGSTDGGDRNDGSFNQQAKDAIAAVSGDEKNFIDSLSSSTSDILAAYNQAFAKGATGIIATGFMHGGALDQATAANPSKAFVYVDGVTNASKTVEKDVTTTLVSGTTDSEITLAKGEKLVSASKDGLDITFTVSADGSKATFSGLPATTIKVKIATTVLQGNVANLLFKSEQAGFLAGYKAAEQAVKTPGSDRVAKVATFGGLNIPSVTSYMDGFKEGVDHFNEGKTVAVQIIGQDNAFVGNFEADKDNLVTTRTNDLLSKGVDVIFPVGGPQEFTVLKAIAQSPEA